MLKLRLRLVLILLNAGFLSYVTTLIPIPQGEPSWAAFHIPFIIYTVITVLYVGGAVLFYLTLKEFNPLFKTAYRFICIGLAVLGLNQLQVPIFQSINVWDTPWHDIGGLFAPLVIGGALVLVGLVRFAKLLDIPTGFVSWRVLGPVLLVAGLAAVLVPHSPEVTYGESETVYRWRLILLASQYVLTVWAVIAVLKVRSAIGQAYRRALTWMTVALVVHTIALTQGLFFSVAGYEFAYVMNGFYQLFFLLVAVFYLAAGYSFNHLTVPTFKQRATFTPVDIIVYTAGLVSNRRAIDQYLNAMRAITSRGAGSDAGQADQKTLQKVYMQIEDYLMNKEPVRRYPREDLRNRVQAQFDIEHSPNASFWTSLPAK